MDKIKFQPNMRGRKKLGALGKLRKLNWRLYSMALPAVILLALFSYWPMFGLVLAFKDFKFKDGIFGSQWMDPFFDHFELLYTSPDAINALKNTLTLNFSFIIVGTISALTLAILLNEVKHNNFKKFSQSITFLPFFVSWVVVGAFLAEILNYDNGIINRILVMLNLERIAFYMEPKYWPTILNIENIWKNMGYNAVVYLAAISGIDSSYYEAAAIDGASRFQKIRYITLPLLKSTIIILVLLALGRIMNADFGMFFYSTKGLYSLWETTDVIDVFVYRGLRVTGNIGIASAAGFLQSGISLIVVLVFNAIARKMDKDSALF